MYRAILDAINNKSVLERDSIWTCHIIIAPARHFRTAKAMSCDLWMCHKHNADLFLIHKYC